MSNKTKISQFPEVTQLPDNAKIPLVGGNPTNDYVISAENLKNEIGGGIEEAPIDGTQYARKDGDWVTVQSADVDKAYVDEQDGLRMLTSEYVGTGATKTVNNATYATNAGTASQANNASYASNAGQASFATSAGAATSAGTAAYANNAGNANTSSYANQAGNATNDGAGRNIYYTYQTITDNNLQTVSKTIVGSINEVNDIAKGAQKAISKTNYSTLVTYLKSLPTSGLTIGQTIYIETLNVPDVWVFSKSVTFNDYIYVSDDQFIADVIDNNTIVGYFGLSKLETGKINLTDYVPYTGATKNVNLGDYNLNANGLGIDTVTPYIVSNPGEIGWNASQGTFDMHLLNGTILQAGQELHIYGKAVGDISNGDVVQLIGSQGGHLTIKKAVQSEIITNPNLIIGVSTENILNGNFGYVTNFGEINNVYTSGYTEGDSLYFNITGSTAGTFTNVKPNAPYSIIRLGSVLRTQTGNAENGKIGIRLTYSTKLQDLSDVNGTPLTTSGQILVWNNTTGTHDFTDNINNYSTISNSDAKYALQDGTVLYHSKPWFVPNSNQTITVSANGLSVTISNPVGNFQFLSTMVKAKLTINGISRIIGSVPSSSVIGLSSAFPTSMWGQSYPYTTWSVTSRSYQAYDSVNLWSNVYYDYTGGVTIYTDVNNNYIVNSTYNIFKNGEFNRIGLTNGGYFGLAMGSRIVATDSYGSGYQNTPDIGLIRESAGMWSIYDGVTGSNYRDLKLRHIYGTGDGTITYGFNNFSGLGFGAINSSGVEFYTGGISRCSLGAYGGLLVKGKLGLSQSGGGGEDLFIERSSTGLAEINNGTTGTYRDLKLRNLTATDGTNSIIISGNTITTPVTNQNINFVNNGSGYMNFMSGNGILANKISTPNTDLNLNGGTNYGIIFNTNGSEKMRITSGGNVGIGVAPSTKLHVNGDGRFGIGSTYTQLTSSQLECWVNDIKSSRFSGTEFSFTDANSNIAGGDINRFYINDITNSFSSSFNASTISLYDNNNSKYSQVTLNGNEFGDENNNIFFGCNYNSGFYINDGSNQKVVYLSTGGLTISDNINLLTGTYTNSLMNIYDENYGTLVNFERGNCYLSEPMSFNFYTGGSVEINSTGFLFSGDATFFDDLQGDITKTKTVGTRVTLNEAENTIDFTNTSTLSDYVYLNFQMSHKWKIGSIIYPHIHWEQTLNATPNWLIQYRWQKQGGVKTTTWTNYKCNVNAFTYTGGTLNQISHDGGLTPPTGAGLSDIIEIRVIRDTANASGLFTPGNTYAATASVTSIDLHYECDSLGSNQEYIK